MATTTEDEFTAEERAAMKQRATELRRARTAKSTGKKVDGLTDILARIDEMEPADRVLAERIHALVTEHAPQLEPKTWYGFPTYARDGKGVIFFQPASKFKSRYAELAFQDTAALDDGTMWPVAYALTEITPEVETRIIALIARAAG